MKLRRLVRTLRIRAPAADSANGRESDDSNEAAAVRAVHAPLRRWLPLAAALLLYAGGALATLRPAGAGGIHFATIDNFLYLYTLEWERFSLLREPGRFFEGLGFYGMGDSLFYTHLLLGGLPIYAVVATIFGPVAGLNALVIVSPVLNAAATAAAAWLLVGRWWPAVLAGFVFAFTPLQQDLFGFLTMIMFWWTPLAAALWLWFLRRPAWWKLSGAWLCVFIQFATGTYLGLIALVTLIALMAGAVAFRRLPKLDSPLVVKSAGGILIAALPFVPLLAGYVSFWLNNQEVRTLNEARNLSEGLPSYLTAATEGQLWYQTVSARFPDFPTPIPNFVPTVLAVVGLVAGIARQRTRAVAVALAGIGILMFLLSLGPELWWNGQLTGQGLPFAVAHDLIPGFSSFRIASFFAAGTMLPMALLAAVACDRFARSPRLVGRRQLAVALAVFVVLAAEFARPPVHVGPPPNQRALQQALAESQHGAVAFIPSGAGFPTPDPFMRRMWWTLNGGHRPVVSGYSGYAPRGTHHLARLIDWTDATQRRSVAEALVSWGVRSIVLDREYLSAPETEEWQAVIQAVDPSVRTFDSGRFVVHHLGPVEVASTTTWTEVNVQPVLQSARPAARVVVPIVFHNQASGPWRPPPGRPTRAGELVWTSDDASVSHRQSFKLHAPPLIPANRAAQALTPVHIQTPAMPGRYRLELLADGERLATTHVDVGAGQLPQGPRETDIRVLAQPECVRAGESTFLQIQAHNTGATTWDGEFRLGTRWTAIDDARVVSELEDRLFMLPWLRVPTGSGVVFEGLVKAPVQPGFYRLTMGMVEEHVAWFGERDTLVQVFGPDQREACAV